MNTFTLQSPNDKSPYIGMDIHNIIPTGQNPVRYYNIETKKK